ncbi:YoaK family protein [Paraburkholderia sp. C35]|uniref:YoaK family protein n=1 Tax=Paraburkholderia sp. C35 TaxID=2126993 RepID=UPI000D686CB3|nr:YoaK family protein [Paraburkholderia sp. C35]
MTPLELAGRSRGVAVLLTLSGGFLDAFTYVGHGGVFANAMSGNIALLGIHMASGDWTQAARHVPPLVAFVLAVCVAHLLSLTRVNQYIRRPALVCLLLEIGFLALAASNLVPVSDIWLIPGITFVATLQTLSFTHVGNLAYTSVMTTGNLRRATKMLLEGLIPRYDKGALHDASLLGAAGFCFLTGAVLGGYTTAVAKDKAMWIAVLLLVAALARMCQLARRESVRRSAESNSSNFA